MSETGELRVLVVGAGAIGGYFGGRLAEAGRDVTFLVRPGRAAQLAQDGLVVRSPRGDLHLPRPVMVQAAELDHPFDLILLSCKAYDLTSAMDGIAPAVAAGTVIVPLLNGMSHLAALDARFPTAHVFGGQCQIAATLDRAGTVLHLAPMHALSFGARDTAGVSRVAAVAGVLLDAGFDARASDAIMMDMWEKWVFLTTLAAATCLMRAAVGDIVTGGGEEVMRGLFEECRATAAAEGFPPRDAFLERSLTMLTKADSTFTASMLRDVENGGRVEVEHVVGDMLRRRQVHGGGPGGLLRLAYLHLKAYEARRARETAPA